MAGRKVLVVGLDGATWHVLAPLLDEGAMPTLASLRANGVGGILTSTIPPITPAAWGTFQTGVNPENHGVFGFINFDKRTHRLELASSRSLKARTLWELVSDHERRVTAINVPLTYPARAVNGSIITGLPTPGPDSQFTYPDSLRDELQRKFGEYQLLEGRKVWNATRDVRQFIATMTELIQFRTEVALYMLDRQDWDLFMVHFQAVDAVQHAMWSYLDRAHPGFDSAQHGVVAGFYSALDDCLGRLLRAVPDGTTTILMSDHGFQGCEKKVLLNNWLRRRGYLVPEGKSLMGRAIGKLFVTARHLDRFNVRNRLLSRGAKARLGSLELGQAINWERSRAYASGPVTSFGLVYLTNCESQAELEQVRDGLVKDLAELTDDVTGEKIVQSFMLGEDVYRASALPTVPDLVVRLRPGYAVAPRLSAEGLFQSVNSRRDYGVGIHHEDGIFLFAGPGIARADAVPNGTMRANIADITPTILYLLDLPVAPKMDGKVLHGLLDPDYRGRHPIRQYESASQAGQETGEGYTPEEEEQIKDTLRALGYLD